MAKMQYQEIEPKPEGIPPNQISEYFGYVLRMAISANVQVIVLKSFLADNNIQIDPAKYEAACLHEQEREIEKAAARSELVGRMATKVMSSVSYRPPQ